MSDTSEERSPRFSRAILGRIVAVLAFVGLGTFAVIQSVVGDRNTPAEASLEAPADGDAQPLQQDKSPAKPLENKLSVKSSFQPTANPASTNKISFEKQPAPATQSKTGTQIKPFSPPSRLALAITRSPNRIRPAPHSLCRVKPPLLIHPLGSALIANKPMPNRRHLLRTKTALPSQRQLCRQSSRPNMKRSPQNRFVRHFSRLSFPPNRSRKLHASRHRVVPA